MRLLLLPPLPPGCPSSWLCRLPPQQGVLTLRLGELGTYVINKQVRRGCRWGGRMLSGRY